MVSGTTLKGIIRLNDILMLGPDALGQFMPIAIKSIHRKRMPVKEVRGGQTASFALKKVSLVSHKKNFNVNFDVSVLMSDIRENLFTTGINIHNFWDLPCRASCKNPYLPTH